MYDANHAPFELVSHDEVEDVLEVLTNVNGRWVFPPAFHASPCWRLELQGQLRDATTYVQWQLTGHSLSPQEFASV